MSSLPFHFGSSSERQVGISFGWTSLVLTISSTATYWNTRKIVCCGSANQRWPSFQSLGVDGVGLDQRRLDAVEPAARQKRHDRRVAAAHEHVEQIFSGGAFGPHARAGRSAARADVRDRDAVFLLEAFGQRNPHRVVRRPVDDDRTFGFGRRDERRERIVRIGRARAPRRERQQQDESEDRRHEPHHVRSRAVPEPCRALLRDRA